MKLTRFRIRTLMIAVALAGGLLVLGIEADRLHRASLAHRWRAAELALLESRARSDARRMASLRKSVESRFAAIDATEPVKELMSKAVIELRIEATSVDRRLSYLEALKLKYERAARYPWLPMAPDPPDTR